MGLCVTMNLEMLVKNAFMFLLKKIDFILLHFHARYYDQRWFDKLIITGKLVLI
jgi:hypothetical protein